MPHSPETSRPIEVTQLPPTRAELALLRQTVITPEQDALAEHLAGLDEAARELADAQVLTTLDAQFLPVERALRPTDSPRAYAYARQLRAAAVRGAVELHRTTPPAERATALSRYLRQTGDLSAALENYARSQGTLDDAAFALPAVAALRQTLQAAGLSDLLPFLQPTKMLAASLHDAGVDLTQPSPATREIVKQGIRDHLTRRAELIFESLAPGAEPTEAEGMRFVVDFQEAMHTACDPRSNTPELGNPHLSVEEFYDVWHEIVRDSPAVAALADLRAMRSVQGSLERLVQRDDAQEKYYDRRKKEVREEMQASLDISANQAGALVRQYGDLGSTMLYIGKALIPLGFMLSFINNGLSITKTLTDPVALGMIGAGFGTAHYFGVFDGDGEHAAALERATVASLRESLAPEVSQLIRSVDEDKLRDPDSQLNAWIDAAVREPDGFFPSLEEWQEHAAKQPAPDTLDLDFPAAADSPVHRRALFAALRLARVQAIPLSTFARS